MMIYERHANLKHKFGNRHLGYYVSAVGLQEKALKKYIQEQEEQDQIEDELSRKNMRTLLRVTRGSQCTMA